MSVTKWVTWVVRMGLYWLSGMDHHWIIANPIDWLNFALCSWGFGVDQEQIGQDWV